MLESFFQLEFRGKQRTMGLTLLWMAIARMEPAVSITAAMASRRKPIQREVFMKQNHQAPFLSRLSRNAS